MGKQRPEEKKKGEKKTDKKETKEKRKQDQQENKPVANQNGTLTVNGKMAQKKEANKKGSQTNKSPSSKKASGKWSWLGILNIFIFLGVLVAGGICAALYTEGDFSAEGLRRAWPRLQRNSETLMNKTKEVIHYDEIKIAAGNAWTVLGPFLLKVKDVLIIGFGAAKRLTRQCILALQPITGDLSAYLERLDSFCPDFTTNLVWFSELVVDWLSTLDWRTVFGGVRWTWNFLVAQVRVLNEEFWRNEAISSVWQNMQPGRKYVWDNTETVRRLMEQLCTEFYTSWLPVIKRESYNFYTYGRDSIQSFIS